MNFSTYFITRPVFAGTLSLLILVLGGISLFQLPVSEYPEVAPPTVIVTANYPGANPKTIAETVASPLEQTINGIENMLYMSSQSTANGTMTLTVTFKVGTDLDLAQVQVQNRVAQVLPKLPEEVRRFGVVTVKSSPDMTLVVHLLSPNDRYDEIYLRNYATLNVKDELSRLSGVGQVQIFGGGDYAIAYDPTVFVRKSIDAVIHTLIEAIVLVVLVVVLFLQTWRASIIPLVAVPVSLIGTFAVMHLLGFSINQSLS